MTNSETAGIDVRPDSMAGLASLLYLGMLSLDGLAYTSPAVPNGGQSTAALADVTASVADVLGQLTSALGAAGENVEASMRTIQDVDDAVTQTLRAIKSM
jgi:hypothetical protein